MPPTALMGEYGALIKHVHYSDFDKSITPQVMGAGAVDFRAVTEFLVQNNYQGWLVVEDHCKRAETDPDGVTMDNGAYFNTTLRPLL